MKTFAHWKNTKVNRSSCDRNGERRREVVQGQTGPGYGGIQFIEGIPEDATLNDVVEAWVRVCRVDENDGIGFEDKWPAEVRRQFDAGSGDRHQWASLKR